MVHILVWVLLQDISDLIRLTRTIVGTFVIMYELFHALQGRV